MSNHGFSDTYHVSIINPNGELIDNIVITALSWGDAMLQAAYEVRHSQAVLKGPMLRIIVNRTYETGGSNSDE